MKKVYIKKSVSRNILAGHPWCFSGAIEKKEGLLADGELCDVYSGDVFLGTGYYNSQSDISVRILTRVKQKIDRGFFAGRFIVLRREKEKLLGDTNAYRLVFGEADQIPGLIVDVYADVLVMQVHTAGMEKLKQQVLEALTEVFTPRMIYERSDVAARKNEGLDPNVRQLLSGEEIGEVEITENGRKFVVNVIEGQKTGFFLDQRENRDAIVKYCSGRKVLNCFSYTGGFSVYAATVADSVASVDSSAFAVEYAKRNFIINGMDPLRHQFVVADVFDYLKESRKGEYDLIILDPPSFAKNRKQVKNAIKAYITLNSMALDKLDDYSLLATSSCTSHIDEMTFIKILNQSAVNTGCSVKVLESRMQPMDHAYNLSYPEGRYLKFLILQKYPQG